MRYKITRSEQYLSHHGILGMHYYCITHSGVKERSGRHPWGSGKRPFQRLEKPKQKKASDMSDQELIDYNKRKGLENQYNKLSGADKSKLDDIASIANRSSDAFNRTGKMLRGDQNQKTWSRMDLNNMTDQELRDRINRENLEVQYSKMFNSSSPEVSKGKQFVQKVFDVGGDVLQITGNVLTIALLIKGLKVKP